MRAAKTRTTTKHGSADAGLFPCQPSATIQLSVDNGRCAAVDRTARQTPVSKAPCWMPPAGRRRLWVLTVRCTRPVRAASVDSKICPASCQRGLNWPLVGAFQCDLATDADLRGHQRAHLLTPVGLAADALSLVLNWGSVPCDLAGHAAFAGWQAKGQYARLVL